MRFEFSTASRILFGPGVLKEIPRRVKTFGARVFVASDPNVHCIQALIHEMEKEGIVADLFSVTGEPTIDSVNEAVNRAREGKCQCILGLGGGSAIDTAKAIAALLTNSGSLIEYLEVIGQAKPLTQPSAPWIAVPTTAGTGAEVTGNSVLSSPEHGVKISLRSPFMFSRLAVIDPELTFSVPPDVTAYSGLDALTQLIEPFTCIQPNPMVDAFCQEGIYRISRSLFRAYGNGKDAHAREDMSLAALLSGMALANAKLGAVHGMAGPLGGMISVPHGATCARLLPCVMEANVSALEKRIPDSPVLLRYNEIAALLTGLPEATVGEGIEFIKTWIDQMNVPPLSEFGLTENQFQDLIAKAKRASSMKGNPVILEDAELIHILEMEAAL